MVHEDLQNLGLSDKEASVYLAALELGSDTVQRIAQKAKVKRVTTYVVLQTLLKKGLVSKVDKGKKTYFVAEDPERLVRFVEQKIKELEFKKTSVAPLLNQLKIINNANSNKPIVRFFEGKEGALSMMDDFIQSYKEESRKVRTDDDVLYLAYSRDKLLKIFSEDERNRSRQVRLKTHVEAQALYNWKQEINDMVMAQGIRLSPEEFPFPCDIAVYKDKIRLISLNDEPTSILIIDANLAEGLRSLFKLAIEGAKIKK